MWLAAIGGVTISSYPIVLAVGTVGMFVCLFRRRDIFRLNALQCGIFTLCLTAVGVLGAMLLFLAETGRFGGISFYGSVFLIPPLMPPIGLLFKQKPQQSLDVCAPCVAVMIGCLRVNCFLSGCCGGRTACIGNFCFAWPTQMIDSLADFLILGWLLKREREKPCSGTLYPLFMVAYSTMRFLLEFLRDTPKDWLYLSHGQWFAMIAVIVGTVWFRLREKQGGVCAA